MYHASAPAWTKTPLFVELSVLKQQVVVLTDDNVRLSGVAQRMTATCSALRARPASFDMFCRPAAAYTAVSWSVDSRCGMSCSITAHFSTATDRRWPLSLASIIAVWPLLLSSSISAPSSSMSDTICGQSCAPHSATSGVTPFSEWLRSAGLAFSTSA